MPVIPWTPSGVPPRSVGDLTTCMVLQRTAPGRGRLMVVRDLAPGATLHQAEGFGYLCCPVVEDITGHIDDPQPVMGLDILAQWTTYVPPDVVKARASREGVLLEWPPRRGAQ